MAELLAAAPCVELQQASTAHFASLQVSHGHKFRAQEWMAQRFPEATQCGSGKDVVVFALDDPERVVAAMRRDGHARRFVHAATACHLRVARADAVAGAVVALTTAAKSPPPARRPLRPRAQGSLLAALPERLALAPRGHSHCLTVEPVSSGATPRATTPVYARAGDEFATDDAVIASKRDGHAVSRAYFKLREAADVFGFGARLGDGASPTPARRRRLEPAVPRARRGPRRRRRPGRPRRVAAGRLRRRRPRPRAREGPGVDRAASAPAAAYGGVCDANAHPAAALRLLAPAVCPCCGAARPRADAEAAHGDEQTRGRRVRRSRRSEHGLAGPRIAWLWANGRHERTLGATYEPGQASGAFAS
ncbi:FtsJ-like methyltransferase [Aureococcus anophagefferens]|nr:FtsJ-like methyltransferase [Aureococcus anophagefferens]